MNDLFIDPSRHGVPGYAKRTGMFVRAQIDGKFHAVDVAELEQSSLTKWLRSYSGRNLFAENVVRIMLDWRPVESDSESALS